MSLKVDTAQTSPLPIFNPWNYKGPTCLKIIFWASFFFVGWLYHPIKAAKECFTSSRSWSVIEPEEDERLEPLAQTLSSFNNPNISGKVHGIYILTNETGLAETRAFLLAHPQESSIKKTLHIGCAAWHNLDIIVARHSDYGLIVDFNPQNAAFMHKTFQWIRDSATREIFVEKTLAYLNSLQGTKRGVFFHQDQEGSLTDRIQEELEREGSWLESDANYEYIRNELVLKGQISVITENFLNTATFAKIRETLDEHHVEIDTLYLSNLGNFMRSADQQRDFGQSLKHLLQEKTIIIHCDGEVFLEQRPQLGQDFH